MKNIISKISKGILLLALTIPTNSCKDFMEVQPVSQYNVAQVFGDVSNATTALIGVYDELMGDNGYGIRVSQYYPFDSDEMMCSGALDNGRRGIARYQLLLTNAEIRNPFLQMYRGIEKANLCIEQIPQMAQYTKGTVKDAPQVGYRDEERVAPASVTETFFAGKFFIDNQRWQGVPFYLRTGKCLSKQTSVIVVQFKNTRHTIFKEDCNANRLIISIQPDNEISLWFESKVPGLEMKLQNVEMDFTYRESYTEQLPEAYETLLLDAMEGDASLFMRNDQVETAWKIVMPIINTWQKQKKADIKFYAAGSDGPKAADDLLKKDGRKWYL